MKALTMFCLIMLAGVARAAHDARCDAPPYGVTDKDSQAFDGTAPDAKYLQAACRLKFEHVGNPRDLHIHGPEGSELSDAELGAYINDFSVLDIARYLVPVTPITPAEDELVKRAATAAVLAELKIRAHSISVEDFVLDGKALAAAHTPVSITGVYVSQMFGPEYLCVKHQTCIGLLTEDAYRPFRKILLRCQTAGECAVTIRGVAETCDAQVSDNRTKHNLPCLEVWDGELQLKEQKGAR